MKNRCTAAFAIAAALALGLTAAACSDKKGGGSENPPKPPDTPDPPVTEILPKAVADAQKSFSLDLYGTDVKTLAVADYIDENGAEGVSYKAVSSGGDVLNVSAFTNGSFTVTAVAVGTETVTLDAIMNETVKLSVGVEFTVTDSSPRTPQIEKSKYSYDKNAGGVFELPIKLNGSEIAFLRKDGVRLDENDWTYDEQTHCITLSESLCLGLFLGEYDLDVVTTGGSVDFALDIINTVKTAFDETREKSVSLGKAESVHFDVGLGEAEIKSITFGDYELKSSEWSADATGINIMQSFYRKTYTGDGINYRITLTNNDIYDFDIDVVNSLLYTDYDITTVHNDIVSTVGVNPLYQDSTRVEIVDAPENSGMDGKVLCFTPHTTDVPLDVHGIYTFQHVGENSTWRKLPFKDGKTYVVSFDYMTEGTTAGEDISFKSWTNTFKTALETGKSGTLLHFEKTFDYDFARDVGIFVFGKLVNGGRIYFDNYSVVEIGEMPVLTADEYGGEGEYEIGVQTNGYILDDLLIDGEPVSFVQIDGKVIISESEMAKLDFGTHTVSFVNELFAVSAEFSYVDRREKAILTEKSKTLIGNETSVKLAGEFTPTVTAVKLTRQGSFETDPSATAPQDISASGVTVTADGIILSKTLLDLVYGMTTFGIEFSNGNKDTFTLTNKNVLYVCDFDDANTWSSALSEKTDCVAVENSADGFTGAVLKYASENSASAEGGGWFNGVFCFHNSNSGDSLWRTLTIDNDKYYSFSFDYKVVMNGATHTAFGYYYIDSYQNGEVAKLGAYEDGEVHRFSVSMKGDEFNEFAVRLDPRENDTKSVAYFDNFRIAESAAVPADYSRLDRTGASVGETDESVKLRGEFGSNVTVVSLYKGDAELDKTLVTVAADGLTVAKAAWGNTSVNTVLTIELSNGKVEVITLVGTTMFLCDFDENNTWDNKYAEDYGVVETVSGIEGMTGSVLKLEVKNWKVHHPSSWFTRVFCFTKNGHDAAWQSLPFDDDEYYEFSFDYKVDMNGATHTLLGYYYNFVINGSHETNIDAAFDYVDGKVHRFSATVKGSDFTEFCVGLDPRENDYQSVMYIDNFMIRRVTAPSVEGETA